MKIQRLDKKKVEEQPLPQMIREYILHDRGNSIFLGDSFANLPSPVGEGATIKKLFKFNEDDDDEKKLDRQNKDKNEIKIEGKKENSEKKEVIKPTKTNNLGIDLDEIDKIVFQSKKKKVAVRDERQSLDRNHIADPYSDLKET